MNELSAQQIVDNHSAQVFALVSRIVSRREDAEEITQDVLLKVFRSIDKFRGDSSISTWIYRIAYNSAISHCRKKGIKTTELNEQTTLDSADGEHNSEREAQYIALEQAIATLGVEDALLINLFYYKKMSVEELAKVTSQSQSNIKVRLHRIRTKLHNILSNGPKR